MGYLVSRCSFRFRGIPFLILGNFISDFGYFYYTLYTHFSLTISNRSVPRTRHLRLSETTTENSPVHLVYPNIPCVPFLVLLRLVRFCTSYTALSLPAHPVSFQDLSLSLGIMIQRGQVKWLFYCRGCGQFLDLMSKDVRRKK